MCYLHHHPFYPDPTGPTNPDPRNYLQKKKVKTYKRECILIFPVASIKSNKCFATTQSFHNIYAEKIVIGCIFIFKELKSR